ncbi:Uma2 family endonuclease [Aeromicrobium sp. UC242_57]|uniref:Uma2 family endonuclease n=1 Tax=Aeromicrobium sp. UC242_57 TaxID=3374624 RepID=UPI0037B5713B
MFENAGLDIAPTFRVPDVMVFRASAYSSGAVSVLPQDVVLVVEVVSPGSRTNDRITKPAEYAAAGIGADRRVELEPTASLTAYVLKDGDSTYTEAGSWTKERSPGSPIRSRCRSKSAF